MLEHLQPRKIRVGILDFGDGRHYLQAPLEPINRRFLQQLVGRLEDGGFEVVTGDEVIWQNHIAVRNGRRMAAAGVDAVIFNFSVWAWPQYARMAAQFCPQPIVMFSNVNPQYPGLVGMLANSGSLDQAGIRFTKSFGDVADDEVFGRLRSQITAVAAARRLQGLTYCLIGGRSLGIDTTVIDPAQWMKQFGIDVDHVDQFELIRRAEVELARGDRVAAAFDYLEKTIGRIHWTEPDAQFRLTPDLLRRQIAMYYAGVDLIEEFKYDLCGIKGQRELTEHVATADVAEAFLNDPYGPDGTAKPSIVCSTEADSDAALTMQIFRHLSGTPGTVRRRAALPPGSRRLGSVQQRAARDLFRRAEPGSGGESGVDRVPAAGFLFSGRWRRRVPHRRSGTRHACATYTARWPLRNDRGAR